MYNKYILILILSLTISAVMIFAFVGDKPLAPGSEKLQVVASFYPLYFFSSEIGGDKANVTNVTPAGTEPHDYEPTAKEVVKVRQSDLLILNGWNFEPWANKIKDDALDGGRPKIVVVGENITSGRITRNGKASGDPHVWLSPPLAKKETEKILKGFIEADPSNASYYLANARSLQNKLDELDKKITSGLAFCSRRDFVIAHASFGRFAANYRLNQIAIAGISPAEEPSTMKLAEIAGVVKQKGIRYVFTEKLVNPKLAQIIAVETGAKTLVLDPIEGLDGDDIRSGKNYFTQMEMNLRNLQIALECRV